MSKGKWITIQKAKRKLFIFEKIPRKFTEFLIRITDIDPQFCFVCGFYIPFSQRINAKKPNKKSDSCHIDCFNHNLKFENIHEKLNDDSELICRIDPGETMDRQPICRSRVRNNTTSIMYHLTQKHPEWVEEFSYVEPGAGFAEFRKNHFLKPDGRNFTR